MTGIIGDDEAEIEAEIQRELDEISEDNLEIEDLENEDLNAPYLNEQDKNLPDSIQLYLRAVQSRTDGVEQDVKDCDSILNKLNKGSINNEEEILAQKIKEALGDGCHDNPLDIRNKVLLEIKELEENEEKEKTRRASNADNMAIDIIRTEVSDEIRILEEAAEKQLMELEEKQASKNLKRIEWYENMKREENKRMEKEQEMRKQRQQELETAQKLLNENQQVVKEKLEKEAEQEKQKIMFLQQQFQNEIEEMEEETRKEKAVLEEIKNQEAEYQRKKQNSAATKIQKIFRGHRVYLQHKDILQQQRLERERKYEEELERQEQMEKKKREEMERRKEEEKTIKELQEKRRIEEERKQKEEQWRKERKEQKRKDEEKRKIEQMRKQEEEKKRKEMEKREEQEKREKEERRKMEQLRIEEEEKKRKEKEKRELELIEQKRKEERKRVEEEEKRKEEEKKKEAEKRELEQKRKEEDRKRIEEEEKLKKEEQERFEEEKLRKKLKEIERTKKNEELKRKLEMEKEQKWMEKVEIERQGIKKLEEEKQKYQDENKKSGNMNKNINKNVTKPEDSKEVQNILGLQHLEELRLQWAKDHTPWSSTTVEDRVQPVARVRSRQRPRRPFSASKNLPSLTEEQMLQASPPGTPLHKVVKIYVSSLPACNLHGLKSCPDLKSLSIHNCGLMAVEGLEECTSLKELRAQDNHIEYVNCKDLHELEDILLNNNSLTSVQGLDDCKRLRQLDLNNNRVTRLGNLSSCRKLQTLCLDNNQLIMTKGLSSVPNLQFLSCANNHLPNVREIDSCQLLQCLNLQGNNLQQPPLLSNHVLLRELRLDDNSISTLEPLSQVWLPSLHLLSVSQNSISKLESLEGLVMLEMLDVSHNLISDLDSLLPGLSQNKELKVLRITGNPVNEEPKCRKAVSAALEFLTKLDDEVLQPKQSSSDHSSPLMTLCRNQQIEYNKIIAGHAAELSSFEEDTVHPGKVQERLNIKSKQFEQWHQLAVKHLLQHERFCIKGQERPSLSHDPPVPMEKEPHKSAAEEIRVQPEPKQSHDAPDVVRKPRYKPEAEDTRSLVVEKSLETAVKQMKKSPDDFSMHTAAAVKIQSVWRGWHIRHLIDVQMKKWLAAVTMQAAWRGYQVRSRLRKSRVSRARKALWDARHHAAATTIQACYRGYRVRRRVASALRAIQCYDDDNDDDDFNYDEEVDLSAFDFDSGLLDEGWTPSDTPQLPSRGPILPSPGKSSFQSRSDQPDFYVPRQAWRSADSPMEQGLPANQRRVPEMHRDQQMLEPDLMSVTSGTQSHLAHRAEEMSNEWGVKNPATAELMWKRANRMKYNPARKRKLLDPNKRLALFKKLDEANKLREVKPPPKRQAQRIDYFAARDASILPSGSNTPTSERETKAQMTYSWVYNQGVMHVDQDQPHLGFTSTAAVETNKKQPSKRSPSKSRSPISLPHMDPVSLTGRNVPLVSSPALIRDQMSKDPTIPDRRYSSASEQIHFPPIKTHSVPNLTARSAASGASGSNAEKSNSAGARMIKERRQRR